MIKIGKSKFQFGGAQFQFYFLLGGTAPQAPPQLRACIGPRKFLRLPENILSFRSKKEFIGWPWPDINVNFSLAENIFNLRMAKTDALINRTHPPPPHPGEMWGIYGE